MKFITITKINNFKLYNMARFILDIGNVEESQIEIVSEKIRNLFSEDIVNIVCVDITNENQFHSNHTEKNNLNDIQMRNFNIHNNPITSKHFK